MHGCGVVTASKACTKAWVTCVATCDATKFRGGDLGKMEQKCSKSRDNWLWSATLTGNSDHHIYISTRMNCKTHGFLANPANRTVETSSKTHGLLRAPSPCLTHLFNNKTSTPLNVKSAARIMIRFDCEIVERRRSETHTWDGC